MVVSGVPGVVLAVVAPVATEGLEFSVEFSVERDILDVKVPKFIVRHTLKIFMQKCSAKKVLFFRNELVFLQLHALSCTSCTNYKLF